MLDVGLSARPRFGQISKQNSWKVLSPPLTIVRRNIGKPPYGGEESL
jgi:hypothetical protein